MYAGWGPPPRAREAARPLVEVKGVVVDVVVVQVVDARAARLRLEGLVHLDASGGR